VSKHAKDTSGAATAEVAAVPATPSAVAERSIAVLPFVDMSEKKDQEYFSDGLSDELINLLGKDTRTSRSSPHVLLLFQRQAIDSSGDSQGPEGLARA